MKKLSLLILMVTLSASPLHAVTPPTKARAYFKICYGISALLAGAASPVMAGCHFLAGKALSGVSEKVRKVNDKIRIKDGEKSILGKVLGEISKFTKTALYGTEKVIEKQTSRLNALGGFDLAMPLFLVPLGLRAIKSGQKELRELSIANSNKMQIAGDKAKKS